MCSGSASAALYLLAYGSEEKSRLLTSVVLLSLQPTTVRAHWLYDIFNLAGFKPDFVAGHSLGELSALYAAGALKRDEFANFVAPITAMATNTEGSGNGGMAAVIGDGALNISITVPGVWIANRNSPRQVVITGGASEVKRQSSLLESQGFKVVALSVANAYHSPHMQGASDYFMKLLSTAEVEAPRKAKVFSNVTAEAYPVNSASVREILSRHITSSVRFVEQIENMYAQGARVFVEFGPRNTLTKLTEQILKHHNDPDVRTVAVNSTSKKCSDVLLRTAAMELCVAGVALADFDPWAVDDPFVMSTKKKRKTMLRLSAATYVSKATKRRRSILK